MTESFSLAQRLAVHAIDNLQADLAALKDAIWLAEPGRETFRKLIEDRTPSASMLRNLHSRLKELYESWPTLPQQAFVCGPGWRLQPLGRECTHEGLEGFCSECKPGMREMMEEASLRG